MLMHFEVSIIPILGRRKLTHIYISLLAKGHTAKCSGAKIHIQAVDSRVNAFKCYE